jgi:hypothetical protein
MNNSAGIWHHLTRCRPRGRPAYHVIQLSEVITTRLHVRVFGAKDALPCFECPSKQGFRGIIVTHIVAKRCQVIDSTEGVWMIGTENALRGRQGSTVQPLGIGVLALALKQVRQVVDGGERVRMIDTKNALPRFKCPVKQSFGGIIFALIVQQRPEVDGNESWNHRLCPNK